MYGKRACDILQEWARERKHTQKGIDRMRCGENGKCDIHGEMEPGRCGKPTISKMHRVRCGKTGSVTKKGKQTKSPNCIRWEMGRWECGIWETSARQKKRTRARVEKQRGESLDRSKSGLHILRSESVTAQSSTLRLPNSENDGNRREGFRCGGRVGVGWG